MYHPHKNIFYLIYVKNVSIRVYFYIIKRLSILSYNATHHNLDLYTIHLNMFNIGKLHIHNIYNLIPIVNNYLKQILKFKQVIALFQSDKHIIFANFNLYYLAWENIKAKNDNNAKNLLAMVEQYALYLLLKRDTIIYNKIGS